MSRAPSPATEIRTLKRRLSVEIDNVRSLRQQRDTYQARLVEKTREVEEWKKRFDVLLERLEDPL